MKLVQLQPLASRPGHHGLSGWLLVLLARTLSDFTRLALSPVGSRYSVLSTYGYLSFSGLNRNYRQIRAGGGFQAKNDISIFKARGTLTNVDISMIWTPIKSVISIKQYS